MVCAPRLDFWRHQISEFFNNIGTSPTLHAASIESAHWGRLAMQKASPYCRV
jgi:hypothetical protein